MRTRTMELDSITRKACSHLLSHYKPIVGEISKSEKSEMLSTAQFHAALDAGKCERPWEYLNEVLTKRHQFRDANCVHYGTWEIACQVVSRFPPSSEDELLEMMSRTCQEIFCMSNHEGKLERFLDTPREPYGKLVHRLSDAAVDRFLVEAGDHWSKSWGDKDGFIGEIIGKELEHTWPDKAYPLMAPDAVQMENGIFLVVSLARALPSGVMKKARLEEIVKKSAEQLALAVHMPYNLPEPVEA